MPEFKICFKSKAQVHVAAKARLHTHIIAKD
jgi:hypothetical protein